MKVSELELGQGFRTILTKRKGFLRGVAGFGKDPNKAPSKFDEIDSKEREYLVLFDDAGDACRVRGGLEVDPL